MIAIIAILGALLLPALARAKSAAHSAVCKSNLRQLGIATILYLDEHQSYPSQWHFGPATGAYRKGEESTSLNNLSATWVSRVVTNELYCPADNYTKRNMYRWLNFDTRVMWGLMNYGYNAYGSATAGKHRGDLGLQTAPYDVQGRQVTWYPDRPPPPCRDIDVRVPSDMIVFADHFVIAKKNEATEGAHGFPGGDVKLRLNADGFSLSRRHNGGANIGFCDGHVEYAKTAEWIERTDAAIRRWNRDNEPHPETWAWLGAVDDSD